MATNKTYARMMVAIKCEHTEAQGVRNILITLINNYMDDATILNRGGTEEDIVKHAEQNGADLTIADLPIDLIVWDLETTGFVAPEAKILEIGALVLREGETEMQPMKWVFNNVGTVIPEEIIKLTGITQDIIDKEGRVPADCLQEFLPLLLNAKVNVTHNGLFFDIPFFINTVRDIMDVSTMTLLSLTTGIRDKAYDTAVIVKGKKLEMARGEGESFLAYAERVMRVRAYGVKFNLTLCSQEYGIDTSKIDFHRAMGDVHVTHELYKLIHAR